jgi:phosphoglycolate phosphatase-like HAD superfamily hydrolase
VTHVIWDWNGTLLDDLPIVVEAVNACLHSQGAPPIDASTYRSRFVRPLNGFYESLLGHPVDDDFLLELDHVFQDAYWDAFDDAALNPEARDAIARVVTEGATQSVASMLWHDMLVPTVRGFDLEEQMLALDGNRGTVGESKDQHMVHHVERLRRLFPAIAAQTITVIGDLVDDAEAARAADIGCVLYDGGSQPRELLESQGVPVVDSLLAAVGIALKS